MLPDLLPFSPLDERLHAAPDPVIVQICALQGPVSLIRGQVERCHIVKVGPQKQAHRCGQVLERDGAVDRCSEDGIGELLFGKVEPLARRVHLGARRLGACPRRIELTTRSGVVLIMRPRAIVIGLGVTAVMLSFAVRIYKARKTLMIDECTESRW